MINDVFLGKLLALGLCLLLVGAIVSVQFQRAIDTGDPVVGMLPNMVGEPDHKSTSEVRKPGYYFWSIIRETWTYNNPARTVVFEDGFVTRVEKVKY